MITKFEIGKTYKVDIDSFKIYMDKVPTVFFKGEIAALRSPQIKCINYKEEIRGKFKYSVSFEGTDYMYNYNQEMLEYFTEYGLSEKYSQGEMEL